jgi:thiosulfate sulfurtransferase
MKPFKTISAGDAQKLIAKADPLILDCRETKDYRAGHIDNALHVHEQLRDSLIRKGDKARDMLIYCYVGHSSEHLAEMFCDFGFKQVYNLAGGYASWKEHINSTGDL